MSDHIANRRAMVGFLREELVGPSPQGQEIDCTKTIAFASAEESYGPWKQMGSGEEILLRDRPMKRYGIGVLYPIGTALDELEENAAPATGLEDAEPSAEQSGDDLLTGQALEDIGQITERSAPHGGLDQDPDDFDLSTANTYRASSMAISFLAEFAENSELVVSVCGGRYRRKRIQVEGKNRIWWLRSPVALDKTFDVRRAKATSDGMIDGVVTHTENSDGLNLDVRVFARPREIKGRYLITVCLVNRAEAGTSSDEACLFQAAFNATIMPSDGAGDILPYPGPPVENLDDEERSLALLYRNVQTYAVGHGCAADWVLREGEQNAEAVSAECLPCFETPSITPDIRRDDGTPIEVPMAALAGLDPKDDGFESLAELINLYEEWIAKREREVGLLDHEYREAASRHVAQCSECAVRMRRGLAYLQSDALAMKAFRWANHATLLQQIHARREPRKVRYDDKQCVFTNSEPFLEPDPVNPPKGLGKWRAFQVAFLLMCVQSAAEPADADREVVELIWFPTGGGKTEAYLGLAAFAMFMRRLRDPSDCGVHVLMRYTLRLLTAQQFQRASGLICAMEYVRREHVSELGRDEFSIGIWLGTSTTPNKRSDAISILRRLQKGDRFTENCFLLSRCPWCGAQMGPLEYKGRPPARAPRVVGYEESRGTVVYKCVETKCRFSDGLSVYVIDEDIYEKRPTLVIGTVDKFAMIAWRPEARALFGIGHDGNRECSPPGLIIQDELHLISGPLGSLVGLYETVIEELSTDRRTQDTVRPKIVSSTATIRSYAEQIRCLYGRASTALFPPPMLDVSDSFFARYATAEDGKRSPGQLYVGVHAPGLGSVQTAQVRTFTSLLQWPVPLPQDERDPWWTLLLFFNSLRELGTTLSLFQSDIPGYLKVLRNRMGTDPVQIRPLWSVRELTGRLRSEEVPKAISALEVPTTSSKDHPIDVCLASSIIEVGIDIDRLSLMSVVGQPKTTSQYIQVTGRVGRTWWERPGLVVTIYSPTKPRDRSHFEKFRSYHERLYAQVEPTSVTPFSPPALDRALHAIMVAYARLTGGSQVASSPYPFPADRLATLHGLILPRVQATDPDEVGNFEKVFRRRAEEWEAWERKHWEARSQSSDAPMLRGTESYVPREWAKISWPTPRSMRNVDAECAVEITSLYSQDGGSEDA